MLKNNSKTQKGFTIIEVLIVLAIAGLILLIVFLAVPALQRNSRNTQVKNSAAAVLGALSEYQNNNSGQLPAIANITAAADGTVTVGAAASAQATGKIQPGYSISNSAAVATTAETAGVFHVGINQKCNGNTAYTAAPRSVAVSFVIETSGTGKAVQCVES